LKEGIPGALPGIGGGALKFFGSVL
jgi:hypothetical protein